MFENLTTIDEFLNYSLSAILLFLFRLIINYFHDFVETASLESIFGFTEM